jgi:hypothetical protein
MCRIISVGLWVSFWGSIINLADLENAGYAEVDGFIASHALTPAK